MQVLTGVCDGCRQHSEDCSTLTEAWEFINQHRAHNAEFAALPSHPPDWAEGQQQRLIQHHEQGTYSSLHLITAVICIEVAFCVLSDPALEDHHNHAQGSAQQPPCTAASKLLLSP